MADTPDSQRSAGRGITRVVILGGGFAGVYAARHLERLVRHDPTVHLTLVSRSNYFLMTPLLFEAGSGVLEPRHAVNPIRPLLRKTRFVQAEVRGVDLDRRVVDTRPAHDEAYAIDYDHLVLALGGVVNTSLIPGSAHARTFKTLGDAIELRNHVIRSFERADVEPDPDRKRALLTFVIIGGGLVGVELVGELTEFLDSVCDTYGRVDRKEIRVELIEGAPRLVPEIDEELADYAQKVLEKRGVRVRLNVRVKTIEPGLVRLPAPERKDGGSAESDAGETIRTETTVLATGVIPSPLVAGLPVDRDKKGRVKVEPTLRSLARPEVWALGDCASIPDPDGHPYPPLAQHALREAKVIARNIAAAIHGGPLRPFVYHSKGTLAALGHFKGVGRVGPFRIYGFVAWWVWRTYYVMQMPQWSRRVRIVIDWTVALLFRNDIVQLDLGRTDAADHEKPNRGP